MFNFSRREVTKKKVRRSVCKGEEEEEKEEKEEEEEKEEGEEVEKEVMRDFKWQSMNPL